MTDVAHEWAEKMANDPRMVEAFVQLNKKLESVALDALARHRNALVPSRGAIAEAIADAATLAIVTTLPLMAEMIATHQQAAEATR